MISNVLVWKAEMRISTNGKINRSPGTVGFNIKSQSTSLAIIATLS